MKVIVTGSEGFIGKALVTALLKRNVEVIRVDRKIGIEAGEYFSKADLSDVDIVYHLAAQTSVFNNNKNDIIRDNIEVFKTVCDACARNKTRFIYASSSTANPCNTTSLYGLSKHFDEEYAKYYYPEATGVRFHNVYGPDPRQGTLLWCLLNQERVKLYNGGKNKRCFTYIDDVVGGLIAVEKLCLTLVNIACPRILTIEQFAVVVRCYNGVYFELVEEKREFDNFHQKVNEDIFTLPLHYTDIHDGMKKIFGQIENEKEK